MKLHNNPIHPALPDVQVAIGYSVLYNDYDKVDPYLLIKDIPTLALLNFVVTLIRVREKSGLVIIKFNN